MSFEVDIRKFAAKAKDNADQVVGSTMFDIVKAIDEKSPVGNPSNWKDWKEGSIADNADHWLVKSGFVKEGYAGGHFRGNWQLGIGSLPSGTIDGVDPTGVATVMKAYSKIPKKAAGHIYYYANNLPYAIPLEEGHSHQAPNGMVALTQVEFQGMIQRALSELK
jgi:hypothetical protein